MLKLFQNLIGLGSKVNYSELMNNQGVIVDVRRKEEFSFGHVKNSKNIPLHELQAKLGTLDKSKPIITCCASGIRSASAKSILKSKGFETVHNGGGWKSLEDKLKKGL
jgi:rhodanese-related sulfurtransferase